MRVAIFSDVHGNLTALEAVLAEIDAHGVDEIVFAGDLCLGGPRPQDCVDLLRHRDDISTIYGNTDQMIDSPPLLSRDIEDEERERWQQVHDMTTWTRETISAMNRAWLREMPFHRRYSPTVQPQDDLLVVHANPIDVDRVIFPPIDLQKEKYGEVRQNDGDLDTLLEGIAGGIIAFGHLHIPSIRHWNDLTLVNISSVSIPGDGDPRAKYTLFEWTGDEWRVELHRVSYDIQKEIDAYKQNRPPQWEEAVKTLEEQGMIPQNV